MSIKPEIANGNWKKQEELKELKKQSLELDRKIAKTLSSPNKVNSQDDLDEQENLSQEAIKKDNYFYSVKI